MSIECVWTVENATKKDLQLSSQIDYQKNKFGFLQQLILKKYYRLKDLQDQYPMYSSYYKFTKAPSERGFVCGIVLRVQERNEDYVLNIMDPEGVYLVKFKKQDLKEVILPGVQLGLYLKKKQFKSSTKKGVPAGVELLESTFSNALPESELENYFSAGFKPCEWKNTTDHKVVIISDIHVGNYTFCEQNFLSCIGKINSDKRIKYLLMNGDLVDGCEVYPGQKVDLQIKSFKKQYQKLVSYLKLLRSDIQILVVPGNHDFCSRMEPQTLPAQIQQIFTKQGLNVIFGPNPGYYVIDGIYFYLSHGTSYNSIIKANEKFDSESILQITKYLLKHRNICPVPQSVPIVPNSTLNHIIPDNVNVICTGHMHHQQIQNHHGTLLIATGAWQNITPYMQLLGIKPSISMAVCVNLENPDKFESWDLKDETTNTHSYKSNLLKGV